MAFFMLFTKAAFRKLYQLFILSWWWRRYFNFDSLCYMHLFFFWAMKLSFLCLFCDISLQNMCCWSSLQGACGYIFNIKHQPPPPSLDYKKKEFRKVLDCNTNVYAFITCVNSSRYSLEYERKESLPHNTETSIKQLLSETLLQK